MTVTIPESVVAKARVSARFLPAIASPTLAPTVSEYTAGKEMTCFFPADWEGVTADQAKNDQGRFCSAVTWEALGATKRSIADIVYTYLPQGATNDAGNVLYSALTPGTVGFLVVRFGLPVTTGPAAAQKVDVYGVILGERWKLTTGENESSPLTVQQGIGSNGNVGTDLAVLS